MLEKEWRYAVQIQRVENFSSLRALGSSGSKGGTMIINFNTTNPGLTISKAKFIAEDGPKQSHIAFSLLYHMDRLLGVSYVHSLIVLMECCG